VALLGIDICGAFVDRLGERFRGYLCTVLPALVDRLGDGKDQVRENSQALILRCMEQSASPMNFRSREGICLCLIATLSTYGAQPLSLSKLVPHLCTLTGDQNPQVREASIAALVDVYRHVGERVRADLGKRGLPAARRPVTVSVSLNGTAASVGVAVCLLPKRRDEERRGSGRVVGVVAMMLSLVSAKRWRES
ncbi:CLIP-associating protein 1, partial [Dissostichus eleginoides]